MRVRDALPERLAEAEPTDDHRPAFQDLRVTVTVPARSRRRAPGSSGITDGFPFTGACNMSCARSLPQLPSDRQPCTATHRLRRVVKQSPAISFDPYETGARQQRRDTTWEQP